MKRLHVTVAAVAALALASTPAFADSKNKPNDNSKKIEFEINGTLKSVETATASVVVTVKTVSQAKDGKAISAAILKAGEVKVATDTNTVMRRGTATTFASLVVGDKLNIRATCTAATGSTPLLCKALRITATPVATPTPKPSPLHLSFTISGVVVANTGAGATLTVVVVRADDGDDNPLITKAILGTPYVVYTDSTTVVTKAGVVTPLSTLTTGFPAVTMTGTCTNATPTVCTAKRITVIVPTP